MTGIDAAGCVVCVGRKSQELAQWLRQSLRCVKSFKGPVLCVPHLNNFQRGGEGMKHTPVFLSSR